ncbi:hypothetical protein DITRI_Ditri12bG0056800 [Diplodiscus trichospermus]
MANAGDEVADVVLSDVESEEPTPIVIEGPSLADAAVEKLREVLAELDREKQAREAAENLISGYQVLYKLAALTQEAISKLDEYARQRDEALRDKEEALRSKENAVAQLAEANKITEEVTKQKEDLAKRLAGMTNMKDAAGSEAETPTDMLVSGIEKDSQKN